MLQHLWKLTWKRKTRNLMLTLEILIAFVIVFALAAAGLRNWQLYRMPLGFQAQDVWSVQLQTNGSTRARDGYVDAFQRALRELPEVQDVAITSVRPYAPGGLSTQVKGPGGVAMRHELIEASDNFATLLGLDLVEGRWFARGDDETLVVINRAMAAALFPGRSALGQLIVQEGEYTPDRVVGIVSDYRSKGELAAPENVMFVKFAHGGILADVGHTAGTLLIKVAPGIGRAVENRLRDRLTAVRNDWMYEIVPVDTWRRGMLKQALRPLLITAVIGAFMLIMVAFGLFGALWQNTTSRIPEIGLRRALGARTVDIYGQIIAEQFLLSSVAMAVALVLLVQLPLTGALGPALNWPVFFGAAGLSMTVIYLLSLLCSLYPGWRASRLSPTQALHHE
jgi:putative ABC transport system permease protein